MYISREVGEIIFSRSWLCEITPLEWLNSVWGIPEFCRVSHTRRVCDVNTSPQEILSVIAASFSWNTACICAFQHQRSWRLLEWPLRLLIWVDMNKVKVKLLGGRHQMSSSPLMYTVFLSHLKKHLPKSDTERLWQLTVPNYSFPEIICGAIHGNSLPALGY